MQGCVHHIYVMPSPQTRCLTTVLTRGLLAGPVAAERALACFLVPCPGYLRRCVSALLWAATLERVLASWAMNCCIELALERSLAGNSHACCGALEPFRSQRPRMCPTCSNGCPSLARCLLYLLPIPSYRLLAPSCNAFSSAGTASNRSATNP